MVRLNIHPFVQHNYTNYITSILIIYFTQPHIALRVKYDYLVAEFKSVMIQSGVMSAEVMAGAMLMQV